MIAINDDDVSLEAILNSCGVTEEEYDHALKLCGKPQFYIKGNRKKSG